jgi:hypothetical protein
MLAILGTMSGGLATDVVYAQRSDVTVQGVVEGDIVEGQIARTDPRARTITLDNGREYLVPRGLELDWEALRPGAAVRMRYSVDGGRSVATSIQVRS